MEPLLAALAAFVAVASLAAAGYLLAARGKHTMRARLAALSPQQGPEISVLTDERPRGRIQRILLALGKHATARKTAGAESSPGEPPAKDTSLRMRLVHAGFRHPQAPAMFVGLQVAAAAAVLVVGMVSAGVVASPALFGPVTILAVIAYMLPRFVLGRMVRRRREAIAQALPDVLDLLVLCTEAGLGLNAAIAKVAEERAAARDPVGMELRQLARELEIGLPRREALRGFAERTGVEEVRTLVAHLVQSERLGSSIGAALRAQADAVRTARRLQAEEMANKTQIKLLVPLVVFIFPALLIVVLGPAIMTLVEALKELS